MHVVLEPDPLQVGRVWAHTWYIHVTLQ